jgi:putative ABC transport system permease protein
MFNVLLVVIAGISLLVGGIGIMNIMLATVTERTREIGIRRAIGAKRRHIIAQFLTETVMLTVSGGLLGVCFGLAVGPLFRFVRYMLTELSLFISLFVGILFGVYPARQAAHLDPIEALRHE